MSVCDSDSGLSISLDGSHYGGSVAASNGVLCFKIDIRIPDLNIKKTLSATLTETVGILKKNVLGSLSTDLKDAMNYGLFIPPTEGKAGKFLLEERPLSDYGLHQNHQIVELRYKRRLYRGSNINITKLKKLHSKANLKMFMDCVGSGDIMKVAKLLNKGVDPNFQIKETGETPLIKSCSLSQPVEIIKILVEGGAHLDYRHCNGHTPLHAAAILGNLEAVQVLLDLGQSPNTIDLEGLTPLYHSIISDPSSACMERLLFDYSIIGVEDENGLQEIHQACRFGRTQHLEYLLQYKADINSQTSKNGNTPLHICAYLNQEGCARLLLFRGADRSIKNRAGHTAYQQALLSDNKNIAMLIQYYKDEDIVCVRASPKYNDKRRPSATPTQMLYRSRSASRIVDVSQLTDKQDDSGFHSQVDQLRNQARSLGKSFGQNVAASLKDQDQDDESYTNSFYENRKFSRSFNNLQAPMKQADSVSQGGTKDSVTNSINEWWMDWDHDDADGLSSVSGPSQRRTTRAQSRQASSKKSRSQSCKRRGSKADLTGLSEIDANFLPRVVVLQKNSQGFGFVIRGLKASSTINFRPTVQNPALQYFEEIETNSVAARAGLKKGDFILEINNRSVVSASHEETVRLIKASGDILAMKIVTVDNDSEQKKSFVDLSISGNDDFSDGSSIISSEMPSKKLSTFTRSLSRPIPSLSNNHANYGNSSCSFIPVPFNGTNKCKSIFDSSVGSANDPHQVLSSMEKITTSPPVRVRRNTITASIVRPDSITSTDSFYPMPPPPLLENSPPKPVNKENFDDLTLKRRKSYPIPSVLDNNLNIDGGITIKKSDTSEVDKTPSPLDVSPNLSQAFVPPPPPCPPPIPTSTSITQPTPPFAPPPPPATVPLPPNILSTLPKPILKAPKPLPPPKTSTLNQGFDSHLRQAIAKRREQIDNDQGSVASFNLVDGKSKTTSPNYLKQNDMFRRNGSNQWTNSNGISAELNNPNNPFVRTRSEVYSNNQNPAKKSDDNTSRLYLV